MNKHTEELKKLVELGDKCTALDLGTAEKVDSSSSFDCPLCDGQGYLDGEEYIGFDDKPVNVLFTGIGNDFRNWDDFLLASANARQALKEHLEYTERLENKYEHEKYWSIEHKRQRDSFIQTQKQTSKKIEKLYTEIKLLKMINSRLKKQALSGEE